MPTSNTLPAYLLALKAWNSVSYGDKFDTREIAEQYPIKRYYDGSAVAAFIQSDGDRCVICPSVALAKRISRAGVPTFHFYFTDLLPGFDVADHVRRQLISHIVLHRTHTRCSKSKATASCASKVLEYEYSDL